MQTMCYTQIDSPLGPFLLAANDQGLRQIDFAKPTTKPQPDWREDRAPLRETIRQLKAYFAGDLEDFDLPLAPMGTPFQQPSGSASATSRTVKPSPTENSPAASAIPTHRARSA